MLEKHLGQSEGFIDLHDLVHVQAINYTEHALIVSESLEGTNREIVDFSEWGAHVGIVRDLTCEERHKVVMIGDVLLVDSVGLGKQALHI